jgi:hypothetical protein
LTANAIEKISSCKPQSNGHRDLTKELSAYLKTNTRAVWQMVNWLTYSTHASHYEAEIAVAATRNLLDSVLMARARASSSG